ncbi:MAG TPA: hypothetical protein VFX63_06650 [Pyrinomonadaceae bacterium]|nr:hypothetical protein [Pyrinomonadaceae bacterium]
MKNNEYNAAEVVEIGPAQEIVLGGKIGMPGLDSSGMEPWDRVYED